MNVGARQCPARDSSRSHYTIRMIRKAIIFAAICVFPATPLFPQATGDTQQQIQLHLTQAQQDLKNKRPDLAINEFKAILAIEPENLDAR